MPRSQFRDDVFPREYDLAFPEGQAYQEWIASIEQESKLVVTDQARFFYDSPEDLSPYSTINS